jgi:hypothetical protein
MFEHEYQYDQDLETTWSQVEGEYYFISIQAIFSDVPTFPWGWKNSEIHWNDDAVVTWDGINWQELFWPPGHPLYPQSMDMSFQLWTYPKDWDNDGIADGQEAFPPGPTQSNMYLKDSDGDGLIDSAEDYNINGVQDATETSTRNVDTDGDLLSDGLEVKVLFTDPLNPGDPASYTDADGDGVPASIDPNDASPDSDGDTYKDSYELEHGTLPNSAASVPTLGDLNDSGGVTNSDWVIGRRLTLGIFNWADYNVDNMDVNRDGLLTNADWVILRRYTLSIVPFDLLPY